GGGAQAALPEAGRRDRGGDREDRHSAQPRDLVAGRARRAGPAADPSVGRRVTWPRGVAQLDRVRALMSEHELDTPVLRAPDNVFYLTNFWGMKGYDACVFPREGERVLITIEASADDAAEFAWTTDVRFVKGYADDDPRPVPARTLEAALA